MLTSTLRRASRADAILLGFFRRITKLLFYHVRPVFVFDGGVPALKRQTLAARRSRREGMSQKEEATRQRVVDAKLRRLALERVGGDNATAICASALGSSVDGRHGDDDDDFVLPPLPSFGLGAEADSSDDDDEEEEEDSEVTDLKHADVRLAALIGEHREPADHLAEYAHSARAAT